MKNYLKPTALGTALMIAVISTSCGKITEYETKHDCGTYTISTFEDINALAFEEHTPMKKVAKLFDDFCYYKGENSSDMAYVAYVPADMSQFFESEVIVCEYDTNSEEWGEEQTFLEYIEAEKEKKGEDYKAIGNGSSSELYLYFNADMELSGWKLYPDINYNDYSEIFWKTFEKKYICLDVDTETKKVYLQLTDNYSADWPYMEYTIDFSLGDGVLQVHGLKGLAGTGEGKEMIKESSYINYIPS